MCPNFIIFPSIVVGEKTPSPQEVKDGQALLHLLTASSHPLRQPLLFLQLTSQLKSLLQGATQDLYAASEDSQLERQLLQVELQSPAQRKYSSLLPVGVVGLEVGGGSLVVVG